MPSLEPIKRRDALSPADRRRRRRRLLITGAVVLVAGVLGYFVFFHNSDRDRIRAMVEDCVTLAGSETRPENLTADEAAARIVDHLDESFTVTYTRAGRWDRQRLADTLPAMVGYLRRVELRNLGVDVQGDWGYIEANLVVSFDTGDGGAGDIPGAARAEGAQSRGIPYVFQTEAIRDPTTGEWRMGRSYLTEGPLPKNTREELFGR